MSRTAPGWQRRSLQPFLPAAAGAVERQGAKPLPTVEAAARSVQNWRATTFQGTYDVTEEAARRHFVKLKYGLGMELPSTSSACSWKHLPAHALSVFHEYVYWPVEELYTSVPVVGLGETTSAGNGGVHETGCTLGYPPAKTIRPLSPPSENLSGTVLPAVALFRPVFFTGLNHPRGNR